MTFGDGSPNGEGAHETHFAARQLNQGGSLAIFSAAGQTGNPEGTWLFFKFQNDRLIAQGAALKHCDRK